MTTVKVNTQPKTTRRKWSAEECERILSFLRVNRFEYPNGTIFYKKLTREHNFHVEWRLVRCKVRNMRIGYWKARAFLATKGKGRLQPGEDIKNVLFKVCPYYKQLHEILKDQPIPEGRMAQGLTGILAKKVLPKGEIKANVDKEKIIPIESKANQAETSVIDTNWTVEFIEDNASSVDVGSEVGNRTNPSNESTFIPIPMEIKCEPSLLIETSPSPSILDVYGATDTSYPNMTTSLEAEISQQQQQNRNIFNSPKKRDQRENIIFEQEMKVKELQLREKELDMRYFQMESHERLTRLRLESRERIAMRKLELKYTQK